MTEQITIFEILRALVIFTSPVVFIFGIILILYSNYKRLEEFLAVEMIKSKIFVPKLENTYFSFHQWLLERRTVFGIFCIAYSLSTFYVLR